MFGLLKQIFGTQQSRLLKKYQKIVRQVNAEEQKLASLSDEQLKAKTAEFRKTGLLRENRSIKSAAGSLCRCQKRLPPSLRHRCPCLWLQSKMGHDPLRCPDPRRDCPALRLDCRDADGRRKNAHGRRCLSISMRSRENLSISSRSTTISPSATANGSGRFSAGLGFSVECARRTQRLIQAQRGLRSRYRLWNSFEFGFDYLARQFDGANGRKTSASAAIILPSSTKSTRF